MRNLTEDPGGNIYSYNGQGGRRVIRELNTENKLRVDGGGCRREEKVG